MITANTNIQPITRKTTTTTETFDGDGKLITREVFEEVMFESVTDQGKCMCENLLAAAPVANSLHRALDLE